MKKDYSVVIPVFNSEQALPELTERIHAFFTARGSSYEIVFVEDCGKDKSWQVICELKKKYPDSIKAARLTKNYGQHNAIFCGFTLAEGRFIITMDDDLQHPPEEIEKLIARQNETGADIIYGYYISQKGTFIRKAGSWYMRNSSRFTAKTVSGASFRLLRGSLAKKVTDHTVEFVYIDELLSWHTASVDFVAVRHDPRKYNQSNYSSGNLAGMAWRLSIFYTALPLKLMTIGGFTASVFSFLFGLYYLGRKLFFKVPMGYTSIIVTIFFTAAIILFCMGILGEYLYRIHKSQYKKPVFSIRETPEYPEE
ncbi:MAG: glycosyltransferase family 2 protein [Bacteroidota bacterium]